MPQPVAFKLPNEDRILTANEVINLYPQGNKWLFDMFSAPAFILCNNILGITKIVKDGELIDLPTDFLAQREKRIYETAKDFGRHQIAESKEIDRKNRKRKTRNSKKRSK